MKRGETKENANDFFAEEKPKMNCTELKILWHWEVFSKLKQRKSAENLSM